MDDLDDFLNGITGTSATAGWSGSAHATSDFKPSSGLGDDVGMFELGDLDSMIGDIGPMDGGLLAGSNLPVIDLSGIAQGGSAANRGQPDISPFAPQWAGNTGAGNEFLGGGANHFPDLSGMGSFVPGAAHDMGISPPSGTASYSLPTISPPGAPGLGGELPIGGAGLTTRRRSAAVAAAMSVTPLPAPSMYEDEGGGDDSDDDDEYGGEEGEEGGEGDAEAGEMDRHTAGHAGAAERAGSAARAGGRGGVKKSGSNASLKNMGAEDKRAKRLERNRESARQSRRRKKAYLDLLEGRVTELQSQLFEARTGHAAAASTSLLELRSRLLTTVEPLASKALSGGSLSPEEEASVEDAAAQLADRFGPDCPERRAIRDFHFDQLQRLLLPPHTKFLLWLVHQPAEFFSPGASGPGSAEASLWTLLCLEIGLSSDQAERLRTQLRKVVGSPEVPRETWRLGVAALYLQRLRAALDTSARKLQLQLEAVKAILSPAQFVRYCAWVDANRHRLARAVDMVAVSGPGEGVPAGAQGDGAGAGAGAGSGTGVQGGGARTAAGAGAGQ